MTFNRNNFITMNGSRLFTAKDVCDIVRDELKAERERVLVELLDISHGVWNLPDMQDRMRTMRESLQSEKENQHERTDRTRIEFIQGVNRQ
jgi:hypothetical protein